MFEDEEEKNEESEEEDNFSFNEDDLSVTDEESNDITLSSPKKKERKPLQDLPPPESPPETEEDYNYDFSLYDDEEEKKDEDKDFISMQKKQVTDLKSRYSNGQAELEKLSELSVKISEIGIKVASRTQDINVVWLYYGLLDEFWACIKNIPGEAINSIVLRQKKKCVVLMEGSDKGHIDKSVHNNLLYLRDMIYYIKQRLNLGIETDKFRGSTYGKAKRAITEV